MIVLIGFMGAGKTTIGRILAERLGLPFVDSDLVIEHQQRRSIATLFDELGEPGFRQLEERTIADLLDGQACVLSLGGGACGSAATREILRRHTVIYLHVELAEALARVGGDTYRPLLGKPGLDDLYTRRLDVYATTASVTSFTTGRRVEDVAFEILARLTATAELDGSPGILVAPPGGSYRVHVGHNVLAELGRLLPELPDVRHIAVISGPGDEGPGARVAEAVAGRRAAVHHLRLPADAGAAPARSLEQVGALAGRLAELGVHRGDLLIGVGGEPTIDVVGFLSATYHRGMQFALVPTTLEAMADSAIGGKNAVDLPQGPSLLGLVHQPVLVVCDAGLATGRPDYPAGLAEIAKHALLADPELLHFLTDRADGITTGEPAALLHAVRRSIEIKADIVTSDEREQGARAHLNYGHTFSRAFIAARPDHADGALSLGMMAAAHLSHRLGWLDAAAVDAHRALLTALGLPTSARFSLDELEWWLDRDKKYRDGWRFIVLRGLGDPAEARPPREAVESALADLAAGAGAPAPGAPR
ncbi:MAG: bifunctional shikimate kinase/3-dehydroquinate synthase [Micropruina sp.]|uniref:shikimate kinase n=1 Tax=Micropruina sp. TaxID=2737536 RepID=UPI0039E38B05